MEACNREYDIGITVQRLAEVHSLGPVVNKLANKLMDTWFDEYKDNRDSLLASLSQRVEEPPVIQRD